MGNNPIIKHLLLFLLVFRIQILIEKTMSSGIFPCLGSWQLSNQFLSLLEANVATCRRNVKVLCVASGSVQENGPVIDVFELVNPFEFEC